MTSTAKHTPGPWTQMGRVVQSPTHGMNVAQCLKVMIASSRGSFQISEAESVANAQLIAAAPDMLEALIYAFPRMPLPVDDNDYSISATAYRMVGAAIAKATGETEA